jgi:WD40 repeat protein
VHFLGRTAAFIAGEESVVLAGEEDGEKPVAIHAGAILSAGSDGKSLVTGGDDGKVVLTGADGQSQTIHTDDKRRWIDHVACGPDGALAWSAGKTAFVRTGKGETKSLDVVSTVGGLAFAPKGFRLAIAHYNGATLWFPNLAAKPETLDWKGSHLDITFSPNGKFLITAMQEPTLHGWRLADVKHMRMSGYAGRVRSMAWVAGGEYLATGGSDQLILWPFTGKDGPMGKQPKMLAAHSARLAVVAGHPTQEVIAAGFADGMALLVRMSDGAEILVKKPGDAAVTALAFSRDGTLLAFGCDDGEAGIVDLG